MENLPLELCIPIFGFNMSLINKELNELSKNVTNIEKCNKIEGICSDKNFITNWTAKELIINMNSLGDLDIDKKVNKLTLNYIGKDHCPISTKIVLDYTIKHLHLKRYIPSSIISHGLDTLEITDIDISYLDRLSNFIKNSKLNKLVVRYYSIFEKTRLSLTLLFSIWLDSVPNIYLIINNKPGKITNNGYIDNNIDCQKEKDILIFSTKCNYIKIVYSFPEINNLNCKKFHVKYTPNLEYIKILIHSPYTIFLSMDDEIFANLKEIYISGNISFEQDLSCCPNLIFWDITTISQIKLPGYPEYDNLINTYYTYKNSIRHNTLSISNEVLSFVHIVSASYSTICRYSSDIYIDDYNPLSLRIDNTKQEIITLLTSKQNITKIECNGLVNIRFNKHIIIDEFHIMSDDSNISIDGSYEINKLYAPIYLKNQISVLKYNCKIINYDTCSYYDTL